MHLFRKPASKVQLSVDESIDEFSVFISNYNTDSGKLLRDKNHSRQLKKGWVNLIKSRTALNNQLRMCLHILTTHINWGLTENNAVHKVYLNGQFCPLFLCENNYNSPLCDVRNILKSTFADFINVRELIWFISRVLKYGKYRLLHLSRINCNRFKMSL